MDRLDYFKNELIKILDKKISEEKAEIKKSFAFQIDAIIEKSRGYAVGTIREWNGNKFKKMPNKKRVRIYGTHDRHAEISIARLKGRIKNAKTVDELFGIVMNNVHRFEDADGKILPIVEELKKEVNARKKTINIGKRNTQQKIDEFNAKRKYAKSKFEIGENISDKQLKDILSSVKHTPKRDKYINDYYLSRLSNYEEKELTASDGYSEKISVYKGRKENQDETNAALFFKKKGCDVVMLSESTESQGVKHPDFLVNGVLVEVKTCKNGEANGIASEIKNAINKRNTEIVSVFLFDKSAKENYDTIAEKLNLKKPYLNSEVNAIMLVNNNIVTLVDKKNTAGEQEVPPSAIKNIPQNNSSVNKKTLAKDTCKNISELKDFALKNYGIEVEQSDKGMDFSKIMESFNEVEKSVKKYNIRKSAPRALEA